MSKDENAFSKAAWESIIKPLREAEEDEQHFLWFDGMNSLNNDAEKRHDVENCARCQRVLSATGGRRE